MQRSSPRPGNGNNTSTHVLGQLLESRRRKIETTAVASWALVENRNGDVLTALALLVCASDLGFTTAKWVIVRVAAGHAVDTRSRKVMREDVSGVLTLHPIQHER